MLRDLPLTDFARSVLVAIPVLCFSAAAFAGPAVAARLGEERALLATGGALCLGLALRPWWSWPSLFAGTVLCGLAVAVMNVMMPTVIRRRFAGHMGELTAGFTTALSIGSGLAAGLTVPFVRAAGGSVPVALAAWSIVAVAAFALWLPQLRVPAPGARPVTRGGALFGDFHAWAITLYFGLQSVVYYTLVSWLPTIYRDRGTSAVSAGAVLAVMNTVGIIGNFGAPILAHRTGRAVAIVLVSGGLTGLGLAGVLVAPTAVPYLWATLLGVGTGGAFSLTLLLMATRAADSVFAARLAGMAQGVGYGIAALGPLAAGLLHSLTGGWTLPILMVLVVLAGQLVSGARAARPGVIGATGA